MIKHDVSLDQIQLYLTKGSILHPKLKNIYIKELEELSIKSKCSLLPSAIFEIYHYKFQQKTA